MTGPWQSRGPVIGVELGLTHELDAEPAIALVHEALVAAGLAEDAWVVTVPVGRLAGNEHVALVLVLPTLEERDAEGVLEVVGEVVDGLLESDRSREDHRHFGPEAGITCGDAHRGPEGPCVYAAEAAASIEFRHAGRAVFFPGADRVTGTVPLGLLSELGLGVVSLDARVHPPETDLITREHVRPRLEGGRWVLHVQPAIGGALTPFEERHPKQCCSDH